MNCQKLKPLITLLNLQQLHPLIIITFVLIYYIPMCIYKVYYLQVTARQCFKVAVHVYTVYQYVHLHA